MTSPQKFLRYSAAFMLVLGITLVALVSSVPVAGAASGTGSIDGKITSEGGAPLAEVWAFAYLAQGEEFEENCGFTGNDGLYSINDLKAGKYKVEFWSEATEPSYVGEYYDNKSFWEEADEVEVEEGIATTGIDAELAEGATIEGEVRAASTNLEQAGVAVCATSLPSQEFWGCALNRANGTYALSGLPAGEYRISFAPARNIYNLLNQFYDHKVEPAEADALILAAGETKSGVDADLEPGAEIRGTVYSATSGSPIAKISACAMFYEPVLSTWLPALCLPTSKSGQYDLFGLWSDNYRVAFSTDFNEIFGEGSHEEDGYFAQYFDNKPTLAAADPLDLIAPEVRSGIDARLQPTTTAASLGPPSAATFTSVVVKPHRKVLRCRPGFRKRKVAGKQRCVRAHRHRHPRREHRKHA